MNTNKTTGSGAGLGVDLGSLGCRFALEAEGQPVPVWVPRQFDERLAQAALDNTRRADLLEDSLKWKMALGHPDPARRLAHYGPDFVRDLLRAGWTAAQALAQGPIGQTVLAVPTAYFSRQRQVLRQAALDAGMRGVHLVSDSMALAGAASETEPPGLYLFVQCGYSGLELSLIDIAPRRLNVRGYRFCENPSGRDLDRLLMEEALAAAFSLHQAADIARQYPTQLRLASQRLRRQLASSRTAEIEFRLGQETVRTELDAARWDQRCRREFLPLAREVERLIAETGTNRADIAGLLVAGGVTALPAFQDILKAELPKPLLRLSDWSAAYGAARLASQLAPEDFLPLDLPERDGSSLRDPIASSSPQEAFGPPHRIVVQLTPPTSAATPEAPPGPIPPPKPSATLVAAPASSPAPRTEPPPPPAKTSPSVKQALAARALSRAKDLLQNGRYQEAVSTSHLAYEESQVSPELFAGMVEIHLSAAQKNDTPAGYVKAIEWLLCAKTHDPTNPAIGQALADRHLLQARQMLEQRQYPEARRAAEYAFQLRPDSEEIEHVLAQIGQAMN
jgi:hypothetical protein